MNARGGARIAIMYSNSFVSLLKFDRYVNNIVPRITASEIAPTICSSLIALYLWNFTDRVTKSCYQ